MNLPYWQHEARRGGRAIIPLGVCVVAVSLAIGLIATLRWQRGVGTEGGDRTMGLSDQGTGQADLRLVAVRADKADVIVLLKLTNTGDVPLRVDSKLVLCVVVTALAPDGSVIELEAVKGPPPPQADPGTTVSRIVTLQPGESVERQIDMARGFTCLTYASWWSPPLGDGVSGEFFQACEDTYRLPQGVRPAKVIVDCQPQSGLRLYLGASYESAGLFTGPLTASVDVPKG